MSRNDAVREARMTGASYAEIGKQFAISKQRVHQLLTGYKSPAKLDRIRWRDYKRARYVPHPRKRKPRKGRSHRYLRFRFLVFTRDKFTCQYCGRRPPEVRLELDHVFPKSRGGMTAMANFKTACHDCNLGKGALILPFAQLPSKDLDGALS